MTLRQRLRVLRMFARLVGRVPAGHLWYLWRRMRNEKPHRFAGQVRVNTFFPPYPSQAFDRFCRAIAAGERMPYSTYLAATHACPFRCPHCSCAGRAGPEMTTRQMLDVIGQVKSLGTATLGLTGGEPLLRDDLEELIVAAAPEMAAIVFTAGHGLDDARARRLADAGTTCVTVGIESAAPAVHDAVRGQAGSFDQARRAVAACQQAGLYAAVSTVGTRQRLADGELDRMYELAERWGVGEFRLLSPVATGRWAGCASAMLSPGERQALYDFHVARNRRGRGPAVASFAYLESDAMFGCGAGFHHLFIDAAGNVCPCDLTPLSFGNVTAEPLAEIWGRMGRHFPRPRCGCVMAGLAGSVGTGAAVSVSSQDCLSRTANESPGSLPLPPAASEALCPAPPPDATLPEAYRRLLKNRTP